MMTIQELGSLGELLAALATLATLLYLARQVRANTRAMEAESDRAAHSFAAVSANTLGANKQAAGVFRRGLVDFESLDPDEKMQFQFLFAQLVNQAHSVIQDRRRGVGDEDASRTVSALTLLRTNGGRAYWNAAKRSYDPSFQKLVEDALASKEET
jgi:hypothetical protein